jgi:hypothetical protein
MSRDVVNAGSEADGASRPEIDIAPEMIEAGLKAFSYASLHNWDSSRMLRLVYSAMQEKAKSDPRFGEFARETICNMRDVIEDLGRCLRRAEEHSSEILIEL